MSKNKQNFSDVYLKLTFHRNSNEHVSTYVKFADKHLILFQSPSCVRLLSES